MSGIFPDYKLPFQLDKRLQKKKFPCLFFSEIIESQLNTLKKASNFHFPLLMFVEDDASTQNNFLVEFISEKFLQKIQQIKNYQDLGDDWKILSNEINNFLEFNKKANTVYLFIQKKFFSFNSNIYYLFLLYNIPSNVLT